MEPPHVRPAELARNSNEEFSHFAAEVHATVVRLVLPSLDFHIEASIMPPTVGAAQSLHMEKLRAGLRFAADTSRCQPELPTAIAT
jgi:hypothetical protein